MKKFNSLDLETYGKEKIKPYCFCIIYESKAFVFYGEGCVDKGVKWMFSYCYNNSIFYAHNLTFDGNIIIDSLPESFEIDKTGTVLKRGDFYSLCITKNSKKLLLKCSFKILPLALEEIGKHFEIGNKKEIDHDYPNDNTIKDSTFKKQAITYCVNDARMVVNFLSKINESIGKLGDINKIYSISGLSLKIFRENFNKFKITLENPIEFDNLFRPSYYGGRCEVFGNLKENERCYHFDFSGMYTNRLTEEYPYSTYYVSKKIEKITSIGFYFVSVESDIEIPILPFRDEISGKLLFPNGKFFGLYWGEELQLFIENGGKINKIYYGIEFLKKDYIFKEFAETCNKMRKKSQYDKTLWKLIPNSFIGRLGLRYDDESTIIIKNDVYDPRKLDVICDKRINDTWIVRIRNKERVKKRKGNVVYPSIVTSKARILWWTSSIEVIKNKGRLLYCDTDSIFAAFKKEDSPLGKTHGQVYWDPNNEDTELEDACFATSKVYYKVSKGKKTIKIKGISQKYIEEMTIDKFKDLFYNESKESFHSLNFEKSKLQLKITELNKLIDFSSYEKRIFKKGKKETDSLKIEKNYPI